MISAELYEQLVDFVEGTMSEEQRRAFQTRLDSDDELQSELEWELMLRQKDDMFEEVADIVDKKPGAVVKGFSFYLPLIAASVLALVLTGILGLMQNDTRQNDVVIKEKPKEDPIVPEDSVINIPKTGNSFDHQLAYNEFHSKYKPGQRLPEDLANVQIAYLESDYRAVLEEAGNLSTVRGEGGNTVPVALPVFFKGLAYLELNKPNQANRSFEEALRLTGDVDLIRNILWYNALALLKSNNIDKCRATLQRLATLKPVEKKVVELLKKLPPDGETRK